MNELPLHPALVHLPLGIALLLPLLISTVLVGRFLDRMGRAPWVPVALSAILLAVSSFVAVQSGEAEEERVESIVGESPIHAHEEAAEVFAWSTVLLLALCVIPLAVKSRGLALGTQSLALAASLVVAGLAIRTGRAGGELVYRHGAGAGGLAAVPRGTSVAADENGIPRALVQNDGGHAEEDD